MGHLLLRFGLDCPFRDTKTGGRFAQASCFELRKPKCAVLTTRSSAHRLQGDRSSLICQIFFDTIAHSAGEPKITPGQPGGPTPNRPAGI